MSSPQEPNIPRVIERTPEQDAYTLVDMVATTPHPVEDVEAIAVMPGLGEHSRVIAAVNAWERHEQVKNLIVLGTNRNETKQPLLTMDVLRDDPFNLQRTEGVITQVEALHTRDQAEWLIDRVTEQEIGSLALFVSHWHLPRAYSTVIKTMLDHDTLIPIFPVPVASSPFAVIPQTGATTAAMTAGEAERVKQYTEKGDVASRGQMEEYLGWLWEQTIVPIE